MSLVQFTSILMDALCKLVGNINIDQEQDMFLVDQKGVVTPVHERISVPPPTPRKKGEIFFRRYNIADKNLRVKRTLNFEEEDWNEEYRVAKKTRFN